MTNFAESDHKGVISPRKCLIDLALKIMIMMMNEDDDGDDDNKHTVLGGWHVGW